MIEIYNGNWSLSTVKKNNNKIFVFGDNDLRSGKGGQAIIRDLKNTIGIRTKKAPNNNPKAFYTDTDYESNIRKIESDILKIKRLEDSGKIIVFSNGGYGTGLARLKQKAPKTFKFLCELLLLYFNYDNDK